MKKAMIIAVVGLALASAVVYAQMQHGSGGNAPAAGAMEPGGMMHGGGMHGGMMHDRMDMQSMQIKGDSGPSSLAFHGINMKMHGAMDITYTGNADVDFVNGMIPHHAGAVDMAKTVLAFGKDPEIKKLAEAIIKAQETEIAQMQEWLKKNGR
jgi:uncharacterized protein (DUF305 family)